MRHMRYLFIRVRSGAGNLEINHRHNLVHAAYAGILFGEGRIPLSSDHWEEGKI